MKTRIGSETKKKELDEIIFEKFIPRSIYLPEDKEKIMETKRVYCKECKYLIDSFLFGNIKYCEHFSNIKNINSHGDYYKPFKFKPGFIHSPILLNQKNDCKNFKFKWYFYIIHRVKEILK